MINKKNMYVDFQIFTYNVNMLTGFIIGGAIIVAVSMNIMLRRIKYMTWYENILLQRDLI